MPLTFGSAEELAQHPDVDLVVVTVEVPNHDELVKSALRAGKTVLCEWPLAANLPRAEELNDLARRPYCGLRHGRRVHARRGQRRHPAVDSLRPQHRRAGHGAGRRHGRLRQDRPRRPEAQRTTNFHWEINGTDGDIVVKAPPGALWWMSPITPTSFPTSRTPSACTA